jgi:hypothetical protein
MFETTGRFAVKNLAWKEILNKHENAWSQNMLVYSISVDCKCLQYSDRFYISFSKHLDS